MSCFFVVDRKLLITNRACCAVSAGACPRLATIHTISMGKTFLAFCVAYVCMVSSGWKFFFLFCMVDSGYCFKQVPLLSFAPAIDDLMARVSRQSHACSS